MNTLLYIKSSPMNKLSASTAVADSFIESYQEIHPEDKIHTLDLFEDSVPEFDFQAASAKYKIMHQKEHGEGEKKIWAEVLSVIEQFKSADKYILAVPMWNFSIPYRLKRYIDVIVQPGQTFTIDSEGNYKGLVTGKPALLVCARGGEYGGDAQQKYDMQTSYLELILRFIGFSTISKIIIEPTLAGGAKVKEEKTTGAIAEAKEAAATF